MMEKQLIECVPNISEGRDTQKILAIAAVVESVDGVKLLNVDSGKATNRTVITFVGEPKAVIEAAFRLIKKAAELIDMSKQAGEHPRFGATDVCPLIPLTNITMEETVKYAQQLGERVGNALNIPVYLYEYAAKEEKRKNLANCRAGQYEGLTEKLINPKWKPDFGPAAFELAKKPGAVAIGARNFLVAYNINLNTSAVKIANSIAYDIRESGRISNQDNKHRLPGTLKSVKGIGWYIEEFGFAQVSLNLTNIDITPVHIAFEEASSKALKYGAKVTGSELIGLIPLKAMLDAGRYYLKKYNKPIEISDNKLVDVAISYLGLAALKPFNPNEKIIEYKMSQQ